MSYPAVEEPSIEPSAEPSLSITLPALYPQIASQLIAQLTALHFQITYAPEDSLEIRISDHAAVIRLTAWHVRHRSIPQLLNQITQISQRYPACFVIVESYFSLFQDPTTAPLISGFLAHLAYRLHIGSIPTRGEADTAQVLRSIAKREQIEDRPPTLARTKPRFDVVADAQCFIVEGLLNCGPKKAHQLLTDLKSPMVIFQNLVQSPGDILNLPGFGPQFTEQNFNLLTAEIHPDGTIRPTQEMPEFTSKRTDLLLSKTKGRSLDGFLK